MKKYLFLFTISPVQAFIAQARKAQDLYGGSKLLSDLTRFAINEFLNEAANSGKILFPSKWEKEFDSALPNRFLSEVECNEKDCYNIGNSIEGNLKKYFKQIADETFKVVAHDNKKPNGYDSQIDNHLIINWVFESYNGRTYAETFKALESNLGSLKNIRKFNQLPDYEYGRKDNLSGELNALFFNERFGQLPLFTEFALKLNVPTTLLSPGEGLSAVSLTKRFYKYDSTKSFQSTAEIAQLDIKIDIEQNPSFKLFKSLLIDDFDYQLLYKDNLNKKYFIKQGIGFPSNEESLINFYNDIFKAIKAKGKRQKKYYAILIFDGDDMGKWLSGEKLGNKIIDDDYLKKFHHKLSTLLADFALFAKEFVDANNYGRTIYAGGDDFLALLNLNNIFDVVIELRKMFDEKVSLILRNEYSEIVDTLSFSAGLTIAHYSHPLSDVLNNVRQMEKSAKLNNKNSIAISVLKKSGEKQQMTLNWGDNQSNLRALSSIVSSLNDHDFSPAFIENLNRVFQIFVDTKKNYELFNIFKLESRTFINRAKKPKLEKAKVDELYKNVEKLIDSLDLRNTLEALNIVDFVYRKA
ncbi:MAG: type III-B CRISPR-associated protein Cas10/Cmr2 [Candidatus Delongbacteria bacterium]|nr:type III-B CRISPR-associated protein Cas10/Cmr2 [Candidatus Delongbacteria bacterium]